MDQIWAGESLIQSVYTLRGFGKLSICSEEDVYEYGWHTGSEMTHAVPAFISKTATFPDNM
jgi:hypothetical protein